MTDQHDPNAVHLADGQVVIGGKPEYFISRTRGQIALAGVAVPDMIAAAPHMICAALTPWPLQDITKLRAHQLATFGCN